MKKMKDHDHGAVLIAYAKRNGNYNLWEKNLMYGREKALVLADASRDELIAWRAEEYSGLQAWPDIYCGKIGKILVPHENH